MAKITMWLCDRCLKSYHTEEEYDACMLVHKKCDAIDLTYPKVEQESCDFSNGGWNVQRSKEWLDGYKAMILESLDKKFEYAEWSYAWWRCLDDGRHWIYGRASRVLDVCPTCYLEWGQRYYAINCDHKKKGNAHDSTSD